MSTQITPPPPAPSPTDSVEDFNAKAFAFNAWLQTLVTQANALGQEMQINADVAAALINAMSLPQFQGTSSTSLAIGTGTKSFGTQTGKGWIAGQIVVASNGGNYMKGTVAAYNSGTGALDLTVTSTNGSGTFNSWTLGLSYDGLALAKSGVNPDITKLTGITDYSGSLQFANFRGGLQLSTAGASTTMSIAAGAAMDSTNTMLMVLPSAMNKNTSAWSAGSGNGGRLGAAAIANNTWYEFLEIYNPTTGAVDVGFDLPGVVTYPSGFTKSRHLAFWKTNGSGQWEKFIQDGNRFTKDVPTLDVNTNPPNTNAFPVTLDLPTSKSVIAEFDFHAFDPTNSNQVTPRFSDLATTDTAPSFSATPLGPSISQGGNSVGGAGTYKCRTNASAQIRARVAGSPAYATTTVLRIATTGWIDNN